MNHGGRPLENHEATNLILGETASALSLYLQEVFVDGLCDDVAVEALAVKETTGVVSKSMATVFTEMNSSRITVELRQNYSGDYWNKLRLKTRNRRRAL